MLELATQYCKIVYSGTSGLTEKDSPFFFMSIRILLLLFRISDATFDNLRVAAVLMCCFIRLMLTRIHLQSFLDMAKQRVLKMKKEAGRISNLTLQKNVRIFSTKFSTLKALVRSIKIYIFRLISVYFILLQISRVFYYLSAASLQYLAPTFLLFFLALTLRKTGKGCHIVSFTQLILSYTQSKTF